MKKQNIKIFVSHHKPWYIYEDDVFVPIQVGKKNAKVDLWILWDDTGDNISDKNSNYAELTAHYWVWKNYDLSDVDYIWFCHYRRYFIYNYKYNILKFWNNFDKNNSIFWDLRSILSYISWRQINSPFNIDKIHDSSTSIRKFLSGDKYDIYLSKREICFTRKYFHNLWLHDERLWNIIHKIIIKKSPEYEKTIKNIDNLLLFNWGNLWIMKKELFFEYLEWLFYVLFEFEKELKKNNLLDLWYNEPITAGSRFFWCLGERLFNLRVWHKKEQWFKVSYDANLLFFM